MERERQVRMLGQDPGVPGEDPAPPPTQLYRDLPDPMEATGPGPALEEGTPQPGPVRSAEPLPALLGQGGRSPWDSLPPTGSQSDGSGRQVLRALRLPAWKQYRDLCFLAEGGMGRVFRAHDPSLKRDVALKFLRRDDPEMGARFALEAQHQAMVDHPGICRVYEAGEWEGQSYIAMQFVQGETLEAAIPHLSLMEKVQVMEAVAEAIHAAHHVRLIHRDLKPANIMVTRHGHGLEPTILDFGLAKGMDATAMTQQGLAMGSVHYMAPEQVRGQHARINRRTDVYGLGATLHKVLTGEAPFAAFDGIEAFRKTLESDVPPLRRIVPDLPQDLDTLTRKCLEKDPARRYDSALAVAEDLRRWREGEPILARKPTPAYLALKWARRHQLVMAVAGVALAGLLALGAFAFITAASAQARARHAQHFGQEAERIEALLRYSHLLPAHDVRPELAQARARMGALEAEAKRAGRLAAGPAAYALGRSHLALGDQEKARELLEAAWRSGLRTPEVALALGRALALSYQRALDLARALPSKELREARERELNRDLRDPALARLREGAPAALEAPAYQEAQVAFMGGQWEVAQARAREALQSTPWLFEAKRLEGEILLARAKGLQSPAEALRLLAEAEEAFSAAGRLGPSDLATALGAVQVLAEQATAQLSSGQAAESALARSREAVARMKVLRPDHAEATALLARSLARWTELRPPREPASQAALQEALDLSAQALALEPQNPAVLAIRVPVLLSYGTRVFRSGLDPRPTFREALDLARQARQSHPQDPVFAALLALADMRMMTLEMATGTPPWASFEEGLAQARALRDRFPDLPGAYQGLSTLWVERAEFERIHGLDPRPSVAAALEAVSAAEARGLRLKNPGWNQGDAHLIQGQYLLATRGEGEADLLRAAACYRKALQTNPNLLIAHSSVAEALLSVAQGRLDRGLDPGPTLAEAEASLARLGGASFLPDQAEYTRGHLALQQARQHLATGGDPVLDWARAAAAFRKAVALSGSAKAMVGLAEARARTYLRGGRPQDRAQALATAREALGRDPLRAEAWLWIAAVEQEAHRRGEAKAETRAREAWSKALALDANLRRTALNLGMP